MNVSEYKKDYFGGFSNKSVKKIAGGAKEFSSRMNFP
jgi:hypothetical protein